MDYGFPSLDEELAKDHLDGENAFSGGSGALDNSSSGQDGVLQNVNPSVILDINPQQSDLADQDSNPAAAAAAASASTASGETAAEERQTTSSVTAHPVKQSTSASTSATGAAATGAQRGKAGRPRKRKLNKGLRDENAPKLPQTGYVMYMNERRDDIKAQTPNITFAELTRTVACEWSTMESKKKKKYLEVAEEKKAKYMEELATYQQTAAYKEFQHKKQQEINQELAGKVSSQNDSRASTSGNQSSSKQSSTSAAAGGGATRSGTMPGMDLPIFTEEFLEHNKNREKELRELRKLNYQYEEQNAILSKHVEELKSIVTSLDEEANIQRNNNIALVQHLESLRETLATNFVGVPLPDTNEVPTVATIDNYMAKLHQIILDAPQENEQLILAVTEVVNKLNLEAYVT